MAIIVGGGGTQPPGGGTSVTSSDGAVTATVDAVHAGVLLAANTIAWPATTAVTFIRTDPDGSRHVVRSGDSVRVSAGFAPAYDHEAPLGVPAAYSVLLASSESTQATVTIPAPDTGEVWVKPIGLPDLATLVHGQTVTSLERQDRSQVFTVIDREDEVVLGALRSLRHFTLTIRTGPAADGVVFERGLRSRAKYLVQGPPGLGIEQVFCSVQRAPEDTAHRSAGFTSRVWALDIVEGTRPSTVDSPLRIPGRSYADLAGQTATGTYRSGLT